MTRARLANASELCRRPPRIVARRLYSVPSDPGAPKARSHRQDALKQLKERTNRLSEQSQALRQSLEQRLVHLSGQFSRFTGYEHIESLKGQVEACEVSLLEARAQARKAKAAFEAALDARRSSQRESNDLLQRKSHWSEEDVSRYTDLVRRDHMVDNEAKDAQQALTLCEEAVEKGFSAFMSAILARYHEEQVWSDKIRSVSTYGSLAITAANVVVFLLAIVIVEPWRRNRLIEGVETRLHERESERATRSEEGLTAIVERLDQAETKLDEALLRLAPGRAADRPAGQPLPDLGVVLKDLMAADEADELAIEQEGSKRWRDLLLAGLGGVAVGVLTMLWR